MFRVHGWYSLYSIRIAPVINSSCAAYNSVTQTLTIAGRSHFTMYTPRLLRPQALTQAPASFSGRTAAPQRVAHVAIPDTVVSTALERPRHRAWANRTDIKRTLSSCAASSVASRTSNDVQSDAQWDVRLLYDSECPLCMREVNFLKSRDAKIRNRIRFVDIAAPDYNPAENAGITYDEAMKRIHAILPDGSVVTGVEVFRRLYEAVGLGYVYAITSIKPVGRAADALYSVWAKYRMQITGREGDLAAILERKRAEREGREGTLCDDTCEIPD